MTSVSKFSRIYVLLLSIFFLIQSLLGFILKFLEGRTEDLFHNSVHFVSGLIGLIIGSKSAKNSRTFAIWFGSFYLLLGIIGSLSIIRLTLFPLGPIDHLFHITIGLITLTIGIFSKRVDS